MMKNFSMNKVLGTIKKRNTSDANTDIPAVVDPATEQPEDTAARCVKAFCESRGSSTGDDVIYLPAIVEAAVASPVAASESARLIRKFLSRDYWSRPACQYNAIMLIRILCDNPGPSFTRNLDKKFVDVCKDLLRAGRDVSVRQLLMETLDTFETSKSYDEGLALIIAMWQKEKKKAYEAYGGAPTAYPVARNPNVPPYPQQHPQQQPPYFPQPQHHSSSRSSRHRLPDPIELANRLEEARTSAKLLEQLVASTPPQEVLSNDLIKEFSERCSGASKSIQGYMSCENPAPDNDTMESLIDTNEQLQQALNQHHRAVLQAKKHLGEQRSDNNTPVSPSSEHQQPAIPARKPLGSGYGGNGFGVAGGAGLGPSGSSSSRSNSNGNGKGKASAEPAYLTANNQPAYGSAPAAAGPSRSNTGTPAHQLEEDPFRDPEPRVSTNRRTSEDDNTARLGYEPFHPGFGGGGGAAGSGSREEAGSGAGGSQQARKNKEVVEPVTPISDTTDETDDAYTRAARERAVGGSGSGSGSGVYRAGEEPVKDPGPLYRY